MSPWRCAAAVLAALLALSGGRGDLAVARDAATPGSGRPETTLSPSDPPPGPGLDRLDPVPPWADLYDQPERAVTAPRTGRDRPKGRPAGSGEPGRMAEACARQRQHCLASCGDIADAVVRAGCLAGCDHARERCERAMGGEPGVRP